MYSVINMVNITGISNTINELDILYNSNSAQGVYYSKLALLELCGWIEQTMDNIIKDCSNSKLTEPANISFVEKKIIDRTNGFHYDSHFRPMLMKLIGLIKLEQIEIILKNSGDLSMLTSQLGSLKAKRDQAAHTTITGITHSYDAPSILKNYLTRIHPILTNIEAQVAAINNVNQIKNTKPGCFMFFVIPICLVFIYFLLHTF